MPKCSKCGAEVGDGNGFCSRCGNKAEAQTASQPQPTNQPQAASQPRSQPAPTPVAPKKGMSTIAKVIIGILVALAVLGIVGGVLGYFLIKAGINKATDEYNKIEEEWSEEMEDLKELEEMGEEFKEDAEKLKDEAESNLDDSTSTKTKEDKPTKKASKVVEEFMACTLGTISNKCPTENKDTTAKKHLTMEMRADYNNEGFVPLTYCIQQGPDNIKVFSETETSGFAYITMSAQYGDDDYSPMWAFTLITQDNEWKIKDISCLSYDIQ
ncbi:MAG: hypothetical protein HQ538_02260 [Parcubacteria group bacterium]|nr:hypothetical protein [Parcubacteria group bacterium]